jgi:hypothetical protein
MLPITRSLIAESTAKKKALAVLWAGISLIGFFFHGITTGMAFEPGVRQQAYLKASNTDGNDDFGISVAIFGDTLVVGARGEASNATGNSGDQDNNSTFQAGVVYVFTRNGTVWSQQAYLKASNTDRYDRFGSSVAISGDTLVVGAEFEESSATGVNGDQSDNSAEQAGAAYVFTRNGTVWNQQAYLKASNTDSLDHFGMSVAISGDTLVVGAEFEESNATGVNGDQSDNSAGIAGAAYVFTRNGTVWNQQAYLKASNTDSLDHFGLSVAISDDTVVVGAVGEDSSATGVNGEQEDESLEQAGAAYVFTRSGTTWSQQAYLKASNTNVVDGFGDSVAISGNTVVVGALGEDSKATGVNGDQSDNSAEQAGAAYVFTRNGTVWNQQAYLKASNTDKASNTENIVFFGHPVAIFGDTLVVGARGEDSSATGVNGDQSDNSAEQAGAAYVFIRNGTVWNQQAYLKASNTDSLDHFGEAVTISGDTVVVGAVGEDSSATGVNGDQEDESSEQAGAVYVFHDISSGQPFVINPGLNDAWYNPATDGQGMLIAVFPDREELFLAWFTYDTERPPEDVTAMLGEPGHRWLTAQGLFDGDTAILTIYVTAGGVFDAANPKAVTDLDGDGTMTIEFAGCNAGLVNYSITSLGISGEIPIERIALDNVPLCEALASP